MEKIIQKSIHYCKGKQIKIKMKTQLEPYKNYLINIKRSLVYYNYLCPFFNYLQEQNLQFENITKEQLAQYFTYKNYKINSINNLLKAGKDYCKFININTSPFFEIKSLKVEKKLPEYITLEDVQKSVRYISTDNVRLNSDKIVAILYLMFYTAIRKSELLILKRSDFDLQKCLVKITDKKTKQEQLLPYPEKIKDLISKYFDSEPEEKNAFNISLGQINYLYRIVMSKHLGKKIKPHLSRHGGLKFLLEKLPINVVQKIARHKKIETTMIYLEADQKLIEKLYKDKIK